MTQSMREIVAEVKRTRSVEVDIGTVLANHVHTNSLQSKACKFWKLAAGKDMQQCSSVICATLGDYSTNVLRWSESILRRSSVVIHVGYALQALNRNMICDLTRGNQPNCPKAFLSVWSFEEKKGNNLKSPELNFLKFYDIVRECKCQLFMWSVNFSCAKKSIKSSSENGGNFINKNWCVQKIP